MIKKNITKKNLKESANTSLLESNNENTNFINEERNETTLMNKDNRINESVYCS